MGPVSKVIFSLTPLRRLGCQRFCVPEDDLDGLSDPLTSNFLGDQAQVTMPGSCGVGAQTQPALCMLGGHSTPTAMLTLEYTTYVACALSIGAEKSISALRKFKKPVNRTSWTSHT